MSRPSHIPAVDEVESIGWIPLAHLVDTHLPEPWPRMGCWRKTARFLWHIDHRYMADLTAEMHRCGGWIENPVPVHGGYTQDGTHRIVAALGLGWWARPIPVVAIVKPD